VSPSDTQIPQKPEWRQQSYKDVVREKHHFIETLPFPIVHYPGSYGTWILFQESEQSQPVFCACQREAALGFLRINAQHLFHRLARGQTLVDFFIPPDLRSFSQLRASTIEEFSALPLFRAAVCHVCNRRVPSIRWSNLAEHSIFIQHLGWYFHYALFAAGVSPFGDLLLGGTDNEVAALVEVNPSDGRRRIRQLLVGQALGHGALDRAPSKFGGCNPGLVEARAVHQKLRRQQHRINRLIEERLRRSLGFPPHGKTGGSEILLRWIVSGLFPGHEIIFRARPGFLRGLELDIYLPELRLGIEYQGEPHYEAFEHLGGERHLRSVQSRDDRKAKLCRKADVDLTYVTVADKLTEDFIKSKLSKHYALP